jgi:hypothetical protein
MPDDVDRSTAEVEREYLETTRHQLEHLYSVNEIRWVSIELEGSATDTELVAVFESRHAPGSLYGMRWRLWPLGAPTVESALDYADVSYDEYLGKGIGAEARLGRLPVEPGTIRWLT